MKEIILNSNTGNGFSLQRERDQAVPYPEVARCVSAARPNGGKTAKSRAGRGFEGVLRICLHLITFQTLAF